MLICDLRDEQQFPRVGGAVGPARLLGSLVLGLSFSCVPALVSAQTTLDTLHRFSWETAPYTPRAPLLEASDGSLYGTTSYGGTFNLGTLFRLTRSGVLTVLHSFGDAGDGYYPGRLAKSGDGSLVGVTQSGGANSSGVAFRLAADGTYNVLRTFGGSGNLSRPSVLVAASDGRFYGIAAVDSSGAVFQMDASGNTIVLATFPTTSAPQTLIEASDGNLYGPTRGSSGIGDTIFRLTTAGTLSTVLSRPVSSDGSGFTDQFIQGLDGNFYGATSRGSATPGAIFTLTPGGTLTTVATLDSLVPYATSGYSVSGLIQAPDAKLYVTIVNPNNAASPGQLLSVSSGGTASLLRDLGSYCQANGVTRASDGVLLLPVLSASSCSLAGDRGAIVAASTSGVMSTLYRFLRTNDWPAVTSALVQHPNGALFGTTCNVGTASADPYRSGTVFRLLQPSGVAVVHTFESATEGLCPGGLTLGDNGFLYGTTKYGGDHGGGTAFRLSASGDLVVLHSFVPSSEGHAPEAALVYASDGNFYGATTGGAANNVGALYRMTPGGTVTVLRPFAGGAEGGGSRQPMLQARDGNLYGTTTASAFTLTPAGSFSVLSRVADGPLSQLVEGPDAFYVLAQVRYFLSPHQNGYLAYLHRLSPSGELQRLPTVLAGVSQGDAFAEVGDFTLSAGPGGTFLATVSKRSFGSGLGSNAVYLATSAGSFGLLGALAPELGSIVSPPVRATDGQYYGGTAGIVPSLVPIPRSAGLYRFSPGPSPPTMTASMNGAYIRLTWTPVTGAITYTVTRVSASGARTVTTVNGTEFVDDTVDRAQHYRYVVTATTVFGSGNASNEVVATAGRWTPGDVDGDHRTDVAVYRPSRGAWYSRNSTSGYVVGSSDWQFDWGVSDDTIMEADFDGDGKRDPAVYRPSVGQWFVLYSTRAYDPDQSGFFEWGTTGDVPIAADFDGDSKADLGVYRPTTGFWYIRHSSTGYPVGSGNWIFQWGKPGDVPEVGDFDGDGQADIAVYRPSTGQWFIRTSSTQFNPSLFWYLQWGAGSDWPLVADFDGDGKSDVGVYRVSTGYWYLRLSAQGYRESAGNWIFQWGATGDRPMIGDFDGDGLTDITVYRPTTGQWFIRYSARGYNSAQFGYFEWGAIGDVAMPH